MADKVIIREQSLELCAVCPTCSRHHVVTGYREEGGRQVAVIDYREVPDRCVRCDSPMDPEAAKDFQNKMVTKEDGRYGPAVGRIETIPARTRRRARVIEDDDGDAASESE